MKCPNRKTHHIRLSHNKQKSLDFSVRGGKKIDKKRDPGLEDRGWMVVVVEGWWVVGESPAPQVLRTHSCVCVRVSVWWWCVFLRLDQTPAKD